jgi:acetolactate synthase-1/2/3 large subunit
MAEFRADLLAVLRPTASPSGALSPFELTRRLRELMPRDTILATDVGAIKSITSQAWASYEPLTFFESNGLSAMSYALPAAMAARLQFPDRPVLCTIGDGGFGMTSAEIETCVRERLHFITVVYNDSSLSLIHVAQQNRGHAPYGVDHGRVDFAAVAAAMGAQACQVRSMADLDLAVRAGLPAKAPVVIDAIVDPGEYRAHNSAHQTVEKRPDR